jgi:hypothetical protein
MGQAQGAENSERDEGNSILEETVGPSEPKLPLLSYPYCFSCVKKSGPTVSASSWICTNANPGWHILILIPYVRNMRASKAGARSWHWKICTYCAWQKDTNEEGPKSGEVWTQGSLRSVFMVPTFQRAVHYEISLSPLRETGTVNWSLQYFWDEDWQKKTVNLRSAVKSAHFDSALEEHL